MDDRSTGGRPARCPDCLQFFPRGELTRHLLTDHDYVDVFGVLLPMAAAMASLWDRVFTRADAQAHERLCTVLTMQPGDPPPYAAALAAEVRRRADVLFARRWQNLPRLVACLRGSVAARPHFARLLQSDDPRVREVGRELLLAEAGEQLAGTARPDDVRAWVDRLAPPDDVWEKLRLCQRLAQAGVAEGPLKECLRQLRAERPVACPQCGTPVPQGHLEQHLRQAHQVYQFRGKQGSLDETVADLLAAVCAPGADAATWEILEELARDEFGTKADGFLATRLARALDALPEEALEPAVMRLGDLLAARERGPALLTTLAAAGSPAAHQLALVLAVRLPGPLSSVALSALRPLLYDKQVPAEVRLAGAAAMLQTTGRDGPAALQVLRALCRYTGKARAIERLRQLEHHVGKSPAIDAMAVRLEEKIRMSCPRCRTVLHRPQMTQHVWAQHGMLLYGRRVRQPWHVVDDLIREYRARQNVELLDRCRALGEFLDPQAGLRRVYRRFLAKRLDHIEARHTLLSEARQEHCSLCPHCYALVPLSEEALPAPLNESHGRLWSAGYVADVTERGLVPALELRRPDGVVFDSQEPGRWLTKRAAYLLFVGPPVLAALVLAVLLPLAEIPPLWHVVRVLGAALVAALGVRAWRRFVPPPADRALDHAWTRLVPKLHESGYSAADSQFLASLAVTSVQRGKPWVRAEPLAAALRYTEKAVAAHAASTAHLAALWRLVIEDATELGRDPVPLVAEQLGRCFEAKLPLAYADLLLTHWEADWWTTASLARLRVLACDRAFEAGLEVRELIDLGKTARAVGDVLRLDDREGLARLRLLWSLRPRRPWDRWSDAATAFELAADRADASLFDRNPDLLLADRREPPVLLCGNGLVFQDRLSTETPRHLEVRGRRGFEGVDYELIVGDLRLRYATDPAALLHRLERWFRFLFGEFFPQADEALRWKGPGQTKKMQARDAIPCPECKRLLLPRAGGIGGKLPKDGPRTPRRRPPGSSKR